MEHAPAVGIHVEEASFVLKESTVADNGSIGVYAGHLNLEEFWNDRLGVSFGKLDFAEPPPEGSSRRRRVSAETRQKIRSWRQRRLSAAEITDAISR